MSEKKTNSEQLLVFMVGKDYPPSFIHWPLHITIVPWFSVSPEREKALNSLLTDLAKQHHQIAIQVSDSAKWGDRVVDLVAYNANLNTLHQDILSALDGDHFIIHNKQYVNDNYCPHITRQASGKVNQGSLNLTKFARIKQIKNTQTGEMLKKIVKEYKLS